MKFQNLTIALLGLIEAASASSVDTPATDFVCLVDGIPGQLAVSTEITHHLVVINEFFQFNTILNLVGGSKY
jgi:hypothetical protein